MPARRPGCLALAGPAFSMNELHKDDQGSMDIQPVSAARCEPMSQIEDHIYIGSWRDMENPDGLRKAGITHILNVAKEVDPAHHEEHLEGFRILHIPLVDEHRENILEHIEAACAFIEEARGAQGRCLVHCRRGISRSPAIVVGYLMRCKGAQFDDAVAMVKARRKCVSLNIAFREFLMSYETPHVLAARQGSTGFGDDDDVVHPTPTPGTTDSGYSTHSGPVAV